MVFLQTSRKRSVAHENELEGGGGIALLHRAVCLYGKVEVFFWRQPSNVQDRQLIA